MSFVCQCILVLYAPSAMIFNPHMRLILAHIEWGGVGGLELTAACIKPTAWLHATFGLMFQV